MTAHTLDIPETPAELTRWLERQLLGPRLGEIVGELESVHGNADDAAGPVMLNHVIGDGMPLILRRGLSGIPFARVQGLLTHPRLLLEIQERVCIEGSDYWFDEVGFDPEVLQATDRGRPRLWAALSLRRADLPAAATRLPKRPRPPWFLRPAFVSLATAASLLIALFAWREFSSPAGGETAWGWQKPALLVADVDRTAYLNRLADAADEWFKVRPHTAPALADRLVQLRRGCTALLLSGQPGLGPTDRTWLNERCRAWAVVIDKHLADLEAGQDAAAVRGQADETVNRLSAALRKRAATPPGA